MNIRMGRHLLPVVGETNGTNESPFLRPRQDTFPEGAFGGFNIGPLYLAALAFVDLHSEVNY